MWLAAAPFKRQKCNMNNKNTSDNDKKKKSSARIKYFINKIFYPACAFYLVFTFICSCITQTVNTYKIPILSLKGISVLFLFSLCLAASNRIFFIKNKSAIGKTALHFICFIASFAIILEGLGGYYRSSGYALLLLVAVAVIYIIIAAIALIINAIVRRNKNDTEKYKSMFY